MRKTILAVGAVCALAVSAMGQTAPTPPPAPNRPGVGASDYAFPSPWNPAGLPADQITQLILLTWDDNAYSGLNGTQYEHRPGRIPWAESPFVGGISPSGGASTPNPLNIVENGGAPGTMMGINWAVKALAQGGRLTNSGIKMTFNMITGLYVDREQGEWNNAQSVLGTYTPSNQESPEHTRIAVTWGREFRSGTNSSVAEGRNNIALATQALIAAGSEIGNHTIDHMESNSPLVGGNPRATQFASHSINNRTISARGRTWQLGFDNWGNEGFAPERMNKMAWGTEVNEAQEFGQAVGHTAQSRGWLIYGGQQLSQAAWEGYIAFSEIFLTETGTGWTSPQVPVTEIYGFRAPRLEVNSALYFALKAQNYLYDCGIEDGYEWHRTGPNFLWPYTMDNGVQNSWTQFSSGNRVHLDSTPDGLWQIPSTPVIVPENIRSQVWDNHEAIMRGAGTPEGVGTANKEHWLRHGKVTGFDFNTWILYGMTGPNWQATMQHTLDMRLNGNKAPMQFGMHTDYYTPIYDWATLQNDFNKNGWGLPVTNSWNTWITRIDETEKFVNQALTKGARFVTGKQLVDSMKTWTGQGQLKRQGELAASALPGEWALVGGAEGDQDNTTSKAQNNLSGNIRIASTNVPDMPRFALNFDAGTLANATHIQLEYKQTSAAMLRLVLDDATVREVMLAHRFPIVSNSDASGGDNGRFAAAQMRNSGMIPISAFDFPPSTTTPMNYSAVDVSKVVAIEIQPLAPYAEPIKYGIKGWSDAQRTTPWEARFEFRNLKVHTGTPFDYTVPPGNNVIPNPQPGGDVSIARVRPAAGARTLSLAGITAGALKLNVAQAGVYDVSIFAANGRLLQSFKAQNLAAGINTLSMNNLARGVYMIKVQGINNNQLLTRKAMVLD